MVLVFVILVSLVIVCLTVGLDIGTQILAERLIEKPQRVKKAKIKPAPVMDKAMKRAIEQYRKAKQYEFNMVFVIDRTPKQPHLRHAKV